MRTKILAPCRYYDTEGTKRQAANQGWTDDEDRQLINARKRGVKLRKIAENINRPYAATRLRAMQLMDAGKLERSRPRRIPLK